jgi:hypothetical protein
MCICNRRMHVEISSDLIYLQFKNDFIPGSYLLPAEWKDKFKKQTPVSCINIYFKTIYKRAPSITIYELNIKRH